MEISQELKSLVSESVAFLGQVIRSELGPEKFNLIENIRVGMKRTRQASAPDYEILNTHFNTLKKLKKSDRHAVALSFSLMLELMNACENAYRNHRLESRELFNFAEAHLPDSITYVLTAHPTEARAPHNIEIFHQIQILLTKVLKQNKGFQKEDSQNLLHLLHIAWKTAVTRNRSPKVKDEAEHIYSMLFRDHVLFELISNADCSVPFYVRSWVGGDKDGHPGVNEKTLIESLTLSRNGLIKVMLNEFLHVRRSIELFPSLKTQKSLGLLEKQLRSLRLIKASDAKSVLKFKKSFLDFKSLYLKEIGAPHPAFPRMIRLMETFPALVVPLELRESSDMLMKPVAERPKLAIYKMLTAVEKISPGGDPRWYTRNFIISMCESLEHIEAAAWFQKKIFKKISLPIVPLFEEASSLADSEEIIGQYLQTKELKNAIVKNWDGQLEMMVGYSDSSKESGALASRLSISKALPALEELCESHGITPIFFHGSGGSVDRGGGNIEDQTAWWPKSALRNYKVTVQGEMIERSLASPEIAKRQFENIVSSAQKGLIKTKTPNPVSAALDTFAKDISKHYADAIVSEDFLKVVEEATPYTYLSALKLGSRPSKRSAGVTVKGLRAIPWVLCWTQTRVLFQTWWGVGSAWKNLSVNDQADLKKAFTDIPVFTSYMKALGFTLAKVDLNIWRMYLSQSGQESAIKDFEKEFDAAIEAYTAICGHSELLWFKPWLEESISLRSPMIHPLNLLQILAQKDKDLDLLRLTVAGISSGMMTTG